MNSIYRVVLTGGPSGGKSTSLSHLTTQLEERGIRVFRVPEAATILFTSGITRKDASRDLIHFQTSIMKLQMQLEETFIEQAKACGEQSVVIMDRGLMDNRGFTDAHTWQALLDSNDWSEVSLRDKRYDLVIHMVTAAEGAEQFYTLENNVARTETPEQARRVDHNLREAWLGHPHLRIIDNSTDFQNKINKVSRVIFHALGIPTPIEIERKFLVKSIPDTWPVPYKDIEIEQSYLLSEAGTTSRIRRRGIDGSYIYIHTTKRRIKAGQSIELERMISAREYVNLSKQIDPNRNPIRKTRRNFLWKGHYFEFDIFKFPQNLKILEVELLEEGELVSLPDFIEIEKEVTGDKSYSNANLAKHK